MTATSARTGLRVDPRIRARRIAVQRSAGRRRLRRVLVALGVLAVAVAAYGVTRTPLLDVDHVRVSGAERSGAGAVRAASGVRLGTPMTDVDLGAARRGVEALPWVESATVQRRWPGTVHVEVSERVALAGLAGPDGALVLVDRSGWVLAEVGEVPEGLPLIRSASTPLPAGQRVEEIDGELAVADLLTEDLKAWVEAISPGAGGTIELRLAGGIEVLLGGPGHLPDKLVDLATVLSRVDLTDLSTIDLRVPHTPVLVRAEPDATEPGA